MNNARNRVQLIGRLGGDPEIRTFESNRKMARLSVATTDYTVNSKGEKTDRTEWHNVVAWGKMAERAEEYLSKGMEVFVEGRLTHRNYTDKEGIKRFYTEVDAQELVLMNVRKPTPAEA